MMNKWQGDRSAQATKRAGPTAQADHRAKRGRSAAHNGGESEASSKVSGTAIVPERVMYEPAKTVVMGKTLCYKFRRALHSRNWQFYQREKAPNDNLLDGDERYEWKYVRTEGLPEGSIFPSHTGAVPEYGMQRQFFRDVADFLLGRKVSVDRPAIPRMSQPKPHEVQSYKEGYVGRYIKLAVDRVPKDDPAYPYKGLFNRSGRAIAKGKPIGVYAGLVMNTKSFDEAWDKHPAGHMNDEYSWDFQDVDDFMVAKGFEDPQCGQRLILDAYMYRNDLAFANDCRIISDGGEANKYRKINTAAVPVRVPLRSIA